MVIILIVAAIVCELVATVLGFGWLKVDGDPHLFGWVAAGLVLYLVSLLVPDIQRRRDR